MFPPMSPSHPCAASSPSPLFFSQPVRVEHPRQELAGVRSGSSVHRRRSEKSKTTPTTPSSPSFHCAPVVHLPDPKDHVNVEFILDPSAAPPCRPLRPRTPAAPGRNRRHRHHSRLHRVAPHPVSPSFISGDHRSIGIIHRRAARRRALFLRRATATLVRTLLASHPIPI